MSRTSACKYAHVCKDNNTQQSCHKHRHPTMCPNEHLLLALPNLWGVCTRMTRAPRREVISEVLVHEHRANTLPRYPLREPPATRAQTRSTHHAMQHNSTQRRRLFIKPHEIMCLPMCCRSRFASHPLARDMPPQVASSSPPSCTSTCNLCRLCHANGTSSDCLVEVRRTVLWGHKKYPRDVLLCASATVMDAYKRGGERTWKNRKGAEEMFDDAPRAKPRQKRQRHYLCEGGNGTPREAFAYKHPGARRLGTDI